MSIVIILEQYQMAWSSAVQYIITTYIFKKRKLENIDNLQMQT